MKKYFLHMRNRAAAHTALASHFRATHKWATVSLLGSKCSTGQVQSRGRVAQGFRAALFSQRISVQFPGLTLGGTKLPVILEATNALASCTCAHARARTNTQLKTGNKYFKKNIKQAKLLLLKNKLKTRLRTEHHKS